MKRILPVVSSESNAFFRPKGKGAEYNNNLVNIAGKRNKDDMLIKILVNDLLYPSLSADIYLVCGYL